MIKYEYVFSALGMMKITNLKDERYKKVIEKILNDITIKYDFASIGFLFNAMTEAKHGEHLSKLNIPLYADSGGLQLAILDLDSSKVDEKKKDIYLTQSKYSNYGFIFDEMPIIIDGNNNGKSNRVDNSSRIFLHSNIESSSIKTADNVKKHINSLMENNSKTQLFIIGQGNDYDSFNRYFSNITKSLSDDELKYIRGIAPSDTCYGLGTLERWDLLFQIKQYDIPDIIKQNVHLLGVGALSGFMPILLCNEYFSFLDTLSFDSSSHSRKYQIDGQWGLSNNKIPKNEKAHKIYKEIYNYCKPYFEYINLNITYDEFINKATYLSKLNNDNVWSFDDGTDDGRLIFIIMNLLGNIQMVDKIFNRINNFKRKMPFEINSYEDWLYYKKDIIRLFNLKSFKVKDYNNLEDYNKIKNIKNIKKTLF